MRTINIEVETAKIIQFIQTFMKKTGFSKVVLGLSGGLDSAIIAKLCAIALGKENVHCVLMPYKNSHPNSINHALILADSIGVSHQTIPITDMVDSYFEKNDIEASLLRRGNLMARMRMSILYDLSAKLNALVVGTSNKSEIFAGYCTQFGDAACAFEPIGHIYKTESYLIAKYLELPDVILNKKPSADLWEGQTDEDELGISYPQLDKVLYYHLEENRDKAFILNQGVSEREYELVIKKVRGSEFKRRMPVFIK